MHIKLQGLLWASQQGVGLSHEASLVALLLMFVPG